MAVPPRHQRCQALFYGESGYFSIVAVLIPDYWTQGETIEELETMLKSLYQDIKTALKKSRASA
jgi:predicted RNase H-like HicB family nuclease